MWSSSDVARQARVANNARQTGGAMATILDRDQLHSERVRNNVDKLFSGENKDISSIFLSEDVARGVDDGKSIIYSYNKNDIISNIPYHNSIYVLICRYCLDVENFSDFKDFVDGGAITPILMSKYDAFKPEITDFIYSRSHMSRYEYLAYRSLSIQSESDAGLCQHCVANWRKSAFRSLRDPGEKAAVKPLVERFMSNLSPYVDPDFGLMDSMKSAVLNKDGIKLKHALALSEMVYAIRTAEVFNAPVTLDGLPISRLPGGLSESMDQSISISEALDRQIASGLGLSIPDKLPLREYIEIASQYRPQIRSIIDSINAGDNPTQEDAARVAAGVMAINKEIEKLSKSKRKILFDAVVGFYGANSGLMNAALTASAFGLAGSVAGCIGGPYLASGVGAAGSLAARFAAKKNILKPNPAGEKLAQEIGMLMQPAVDTLVKSYLGATKSAVNVMSLRRRISASAGRALNAQSVTQPPRSRKVSTRSAKTGA